MIQRSPAEAAAQEHDLIVIGGGIYGACLTLEAARRGLRPLLLERGDFGEATSWNSLRLLHGGLRYLQTFDLRRYWESVAERRWFCRTFPELVRPQECLMPLYGQGLKRPLIFGAALLIDDLLSRHRNVGVDRAGHLGRGRVLSVEDTIARFPLVDRRGLRGAGLWYDAGMVSSQRVLIEILRWACSLGATALNYVKAVELVKRKARIVGVRACDVIEGRTYRFTSGAVCNCAGPWSAELAADFDRPRPELFRPSLAFNVMLDRQPPSTSAVAVTPRRQGVHSPVFFVYPAFGRLLAGTVHLPWTGGTEQPAPREEDLEAFLADLNAALPGLDARREHVLRVFAGLLPATAPGRARLAVRPTIWDHAQSGGPLGLVSVAGVKFTTARLVAERTLRALGDGFGRLPVKEDARRPSSASGIDFDHPGASPFDAVSVRAMRRIVEEEAVVTIDDLLFRRTNWAIVERNLDGLRTRVAEALEWRGQTSPARQADGPSAPVRVQEIPA